MKITKLGRFSWAATEIYCWNQITLLQTIKRTPRRFVWFRVEQIGEGNEATQDAHSTPPFPQERSRFLALTITPKVHTAARKQGKATGDMLYICACGLIFLTRRSAVG